MITQLRHAVAACLAAGLLAAAAAAGPYSDLFVFGDSLSDVGNTNYWTNDSTFAFLAPDTPGDAYFDGRFSNGPVYTEWLADGLGLGPLEPDTPAATSNPGGPGGNNFAYGGAYTSNQPFFEQGFVSAFDEQVDDYFATRTTDPGALYTILIGANDFIRGGRTDTATPAARVGDALDALAADGATKFLVLNLPLLGLTPAYNGTTAEADEWNQRSTDYNTALAAELDAFESGNPGVDLFRLDLAGLLSNLVANAAQWGFTNSTDSAAPGLSAGGGAYDESLIVSNPDEHLFWDDVHPTAAVHRLLGYEALRAVLPEGDYNYDGITDEEDYLLWRTLYGTDDLRADGNGDGSVDAADYTVWRNAMSAVATGGGSGVAAPEPLSLVSLLLATLTAFYSRTAARSG